MNQKFVEQVERALRHERCGNAKGKANG